MACPRETAAYLHNKTAFGQVIHPDAPPGRHLVLQGPANSLRLVWNLSWQRCVSASSAWLRPDGRGQNQTSSISSRWAGFACRPRADLTVDTVSRELFRGSEQPMGSDVRGCLRLSIAKAFERRRSSCASATTRSNEEAETTSFCAEWMFGHLQE